MCVLDAVTHVCMYVIHEMTSFGLSSGVKMGVYVSDDCVEGHLDFPCRDTQRVWLIGGLALCRGVACLMSDCLNFLLQSLNSIGEEFFPGAWFIILACV